ncbi:MAG: class I SAM-dependent methyltransferase [Cyanobacteria bacterium P01_H01_bin.153]
MNEEVALRVFFELHSNLPREGPGDDAATAQAFALLPELPPRPDILDIGCGPGMQTVQLARLTDGQITAVDIHQPYLDQLAQSLTAAGLRDRVKLLPADMHELPFSSGSFDLIWAEGSAYIMEFGRALRNWRSLLTAKGCLVISEITWLRSDPPAPVLEFWQNEYPAMQSVEANLTLLKSLGYLPLAHFILPTSAWWDAYYTPLEQRVHELQSHYPDNPAALQVLESHRQEMDFFRRYADYYGYVFYIAQVDGPV